MTIFANERDSENMSVGICEPDQDRQAEERRIPGDAGFKCKSGSLELNRLEGGDVLVVSKLHQGFDDECVDDLTRLLSAIFSGRTARPKYLVFDFAHRREGEASGSAGFQNLVAANSELILEAPVITVAWVRAFVAGADFEFACHCAMLVAETSSSFPSGKCCTKRQGGSAIPEFQEKGTWWRSWTILCPATTRVLSASWI